MKTDEQIMQIIREFDRYLNVIETDDDFDYIDEQELEKCEKQYNQNLEKVTRQRFKNKNLTGLKFYPLSVDLPKNIKEGFDENGIFTVSIESYGTQRNYKEHTKTIQQVQDEQAETAKRDKEAQTWLDTVSREQEKQRLLEYLTDGYSIDDIAYVLTNKIIQIDEQAYYTKLQNYIYPWIKEYVNETGCSYNELYSKLTDNLFVQQVFNEIVNLEKWDFAETLRVAKNIEQNF